MDDLTKALIAETIRMEVAQAVAKAVASFPAPTLPAPMEALERKTRGTPALRWQLGRRGTAGARGPRGARGMTGKRGPKGEPGIPGPAPDLKPFALQFEDSTRAFQEQLNAFQQEMEARVQNLVNAGEARISEQIAVLQRLKGGER